MFRGLTDSAVASACCVDGPVASRTQSSAARDIVSDVPANGSAMSLCTRSARRITPSRIRTASVIAPHFVKYIHNVSDSRLRQTGS